MQEITITIDRLGKPTIEVKGVKGRQCLKVTEGLEQSLGGKVVSRDATADMLPLGSTTTTTAKVTH
jgi:hypothetical protein